MIPHNSDSNAADPASRILIVEDEAIVALDIKGRLNALGYTVIGIAPSGEKALKLATEHIPDLILMDIMLEGAMDGIDTAAAITAEYSVPIVYLTAYADTETLKRAKITQPFGYIIKPFEDRELNLTIEMALYKHKAECALNENRRWLTTTFNSIGDAVITTDKYGKIKSVNTAATHLMGTTIESLYGHDFIDKINIVTPQTFKPIKLFDDYKSGSIIDDAVLKTKRRITPVSVNVSSIEDKNNSIGTVIVLRDISQLKNSEVALKNSLKQLRRTFEETVVSLTSMSEKRDPYTSGHQQRVAELACRIAMKMNMSIEEINSIRIAGILHDIGKISIPAEILSKPTRLTDLEMELMKTHSEAGYEILKGISFPWPVAKMVLQHHERIDGTGYPKGLIGDSILLEARIIAVADVVEAMSSHRPYRPALGLPRAMDEIIRGRGTSYDELIVDACTQVIENDKFSFESRQDHI
ncbi:HD domain-containing phosphohydrolase [Maridesulfovibrio hydrothermalis]|uniref:Putative PAS/PAC sensor protein n=1 Tax=Maridesulfovibrio hydrothermalis AM13 = DSM 14728 TaxID=1121451 RepID=L0R8S7_9BACT|nr:HD domain-containing phosphohydrolase [Maridesulfovibrio hydrothermalis]CCO23164.1 putative PAS/PAC sensor protein [Maridesulfovibrio hydrothermalis AM13 = DSM 14728]